MALIWKGAFWCEDCNAQIPVPLFSEVSDALPKAEDERVLEWARHYHNNDRHLACGRCEKRIHLEEIVAGEWHDGYIRDLCVECAEKSN